MKIDINPKAVWYHGSNKRFDILHEGSTITQWQALAEAFSHKPTVLSYEDDGSIWHNGTAKGFLYIIDEPIINGVDIHSHPTTTMDENAEFVTVRPMRVRLIKTL